MIKVPVLYGVYIIVGIMVNYFYNSEMNCMHWYQPIPANFHWFHMFIRFPICVLAI